MTSPSLNLGVPISGLGGITATGSDQASAYPLQIQETVFTSSPPGTGSRLPGPNNNELTVFNEDAVNAHTLWPGSGDRIGANAINTSVTIAASSAAKIASFDTPQTPQPRTWHVMATGAAAATGIGTITAGANITVTNPTGPNTTIAATGATGVSSVIVQGGPFLANGTITTTGTIDNSTASLTAHGILLGEGTSAAVATAAMTNGQLLIGATGADPAPQTMSGDATINATGTIAVAKVAGNTLSANLGAVLNSGTVQLNNSITLAGTAGGTLAPAFTTGTTDLIINMPSAGGTVTVNPTVAFARQRWEVDIKQGATFGVLNWGTLVHFTGAITSFTLTPTNNAIDRLSFMSPDGTNSVCWAINQGATL